MTWLLDKLVDWWLARCSHSDDDVAADILEGGYLPTEVRWCRRCGAYRFNAAEWRRARPLWCEPYNTRSMRADARADLKRAAGLKNKGNK